MKSSRNAVPVCLVLLLQISPRALSDVTDGGASSPGPRILRTITLTRPEPFWRDGLEQPTASVVIVELTVVSALEVLPGAAERPLFLLGNGVCELAKAPIADLRAIFICPAPPTTESAVFWRAPRSADRKELLTAEVTRRALEAARARGPQLSIPPAQATGEPRSLGAVRRSLREATEPGPERP